MSDLLETEELQELDIDELNKLQEKEQFKQFENFVKSRETAETTETTETTEVPKTIEVTETTEVPKVFDALLRPASVARMLGVTTSTLRLWYKTGLLSAVITAGGHLRVRASEVARLQGQTYIPPQPVNDPYKDPAVLAEAQIGFFNEDEDSIFSAENMKKAITNRNALSAE